MRRAVSLGMVSYCAIAGSTWIFAPYAPAWPTLLRLSLHDTIVAIIFGAVATGTKARFPKAVWHLLAFWGAVLFAAPAVVMAGAGGSVSSLTVTMLFALIPAVTTVGVARRQQALKDQEAMPGLLPALTGVSGLALMLPLAWPFTWYGVVWLFLLTGCMVAAAMAGIRLHDLLRSLPLLWPAVIAAAASAVLAMVGWAGFQPEPVDWQVRSFALELAWSVVIDAPLTLLLLLILRGISPIGVSTRYLLVPLVTILGGLATLRPTTGWTTWLGLALVSGGGWLLLQSGGPAAEDSRPS